MSLIEEIIKVGPNEKVAFLTEINELVDFAQICVSFANTKGGSVLIGVNQKGKIVGVNPNPELKLIQEVYDFIDGEFKIEAITHVINHHCIIEVKVEKQETPILAKVNNDSGIFYYRVGLKSVKANKIIERYLNMRRFGKIVIESNLHNEFLEKLGVQQFNLSQLYNLMDLKPNVVDKLIAELLFLNMIEVYFVDEKFCYGRLKS